MTKTCCPKCKSSDELSVEVKVSYELKWNNCSQEYEVGDECSQYDYKFYDSDSEVTCSCGWTGLFRDLIPATEKYRVVLILDIDPSARESVKDWNWGGLLNLDGHESVTVDGVNKL